jgi:uncharacterized membrane protein YfcA
MTAATLLLLGTAALVIGFAKTGIGGLAAVSIAIFATVMPARESTAAILLLLIVGDLVAVWQYRRHADWAILRKLLPAVLPGLALGALFLAVVDDTTLRRGIGVLLLVMAGLQLVLRWRNPETAVGTSHVAAWGTGIAAGFTTMTANAGGAVMTLYLVAQGAEKRRFLGTAALFFFGVNLTKVPFSIGLGLMDWDTLRLTAVLVPVVLLGAWVGVHTARRLSQAHFDRAVLAATVVSALSLVLR